MTRIRFQTTFRCTPFEDVFKDESFLDESLSYYRLKESKTCAQLLTDLTTAEVVPLSTEQYREANVTAITLENDHFEDVSTSLSRTIFVHSFYDRLLDRLWSHLWTILLGNPGVSKSWFQWYILYSIMNRNLGPNCYGKTEPPTVIVRQEENELTFYFPQHKRAYITDRLERSILKCLNPLGFPVPV